MGEALSVNAHLYPDRIGARDLARSMTFRQWNERACRLANALLGLGLERATGSPSSPTTASSGWRSTRRWPRPGWWRCRSTSASSAARSRYIVEHAGPGPSSSRTTSSSARGIRGDSRSRRALRPLRRHRRAAAGRAYEALIAVRPRRPSRRPVAARRALGADVHLGHHRRPKGAIRSHAASALSRVTRARHGIHARRHGAAGHADVPRQLAVLRLRLHLCGATCCVYDRRASTPSSCCARSPRQRITFTSLVPTHYIMMLGLPDATGELRRRPRDRAPDLLGARPPRHQAGDHGVFPQLAALRDVRLDRGRLGHPAASRRAAHKLGSVGREVTGSGRSSCWMPPARRCRRRGRRALLAHALCVRRLLEYARQDRRGLPRAPTARSATWPAATRTATIPGRPQEQHDHQRRRERLPFRGREACSARTRR